MSSKRARVLELLLARGDRGLNRFEAFQHARDSVLPSTVSALHKRGVAIDATPEDVPGFGGHVTRCARYTIPRSGREHAQQVLVAMQKKAPAASTTDADGAMARQRHVQQVE